MALQADVIIIGAGLMGSSTALNLARAGKKVIILDKETAPCHASAVNAGGVRRLNRALEEIPLSAAAMGLWTRLPEIVGNDCGFRQVGQVRVAPDEDALALFEKRVAKVRALGFDHEELVSADEIKYLLPSYTGPCKGGMVARKDGFALPALTLKSFLNTARSAGAKFLAPCRVTDIIPQANGFKVVTARKQTIYSKTIVNCSGAWGASIGALFGDHMPITPKGLAMMVTARLPRFVTPVVGVHGRQLSFKQMDNGTVVIGGGLKARLDRDREKTYIDMAQMKLSAQTVLKHFTALKHAVIVRTWAGIEGIMSDGLPVIGPSVNMPGLFHVCGFSAHGFQLSPMVGRLAASLVLGKTPEVDLGPFSINRFSF